MTGIDMQHDLNDTLVFVKVVEQGSFTAAARSLGLPKATVSRRLRGLEDRLGARLLNRTTRRLALTEAGTLYYEHSKRIAAELEEAESAVLQLEGSPRGWLRVTAPYSLGTAMLAPMLVQFRERYPEIRLDIVLSNDLLDLVGDEIDVALRIGELPDSTLKARLLASWPAHVYAGEGYLARHGEPLAPEELQEHHALLNSKHRRNHNGGAWTLTDGTRLEEFEVKPVAVANDPELLVSLLAADHGLMLVSDLMVSCCLRAAKVRRVLGAWRGRDVRLNAVYVGGRVLSPKVRAFVDFVAEEMQLQCTAAGCATECGQATDPRPPERVAKLASA
jgi:LysR family transcriptional regulator, regulator for bpeEF and oprC